MPYKFLVTQSIPDEHLGHITNEHEAHVLDKPSKEEIIAAIGEADVLMCSVNDVIDADVVGAAKQLKVISQVAVGFDNIDLEAAKEKGIVVTRTPGTLGQSVAEFVFAQILCVMRKTHVADKYVRDGKYTSWSLDLFNGSEVEGRLLGIVGLGDIGRRLPAMATGFAMNIIYTDLKHDEELDKLENVRFGTLEEVLSQGDIISLNVPLTEKTHHLINEETLKHMKPSTFLINSSRGAVIDEAALVKCLEEGRIAGAALDVFEFEPKVSEKLLSMENVLLTPHIASATVEARRRMWDKALQNAWDVLVTGTSENAIG